MSSAAARAGPTIGTAASSRTMPTPLFSAISCKADATRREPRTESEERGTGNQAATLVPGARAGKLSQHARRFSRPIRMVGSPAIRIGCA